MELVIIMGIIFMSVQIVSLVKTIKSKNKINILYTVFVFVFLIFLFSSGILGGSAYNDASTEYELFEIGHYYLVNHNEYKEVSQNVYTYMKIMEPVGILSVAIILIINIYEKIKLKKTDK